MKDIRTKIKDQRQNSSNQLFSNFKVQANYDVCYIP